MLLDFPTASPPAIIAVQPIGPRGAPGAPGGVTWPSRAAAAADSIPAGLAAIRVQGYAFPGDGGESSYKQIPDPGALAAYQFRAQNGTCWELAERRAHVAMFGAIGTGAAETAALQAAINFGRDRGCRVYFGAATYVSGQLVIYNRTSLKGEGRALTTLKLANGANQDLIISDGFASLTGSLQQAGPENIEIRDMCLDGNRANNTAGRCIVIFGASPVLERLWIFNAPDDGLHTEWGRGGEPVAGMEGSFSKIKIWRCGRHNWNFAGPHDSTVRDVICISASLNGQGIGDNLHVDGEANGRFSQCHFWQESTAPRSGYAGYIAGYGANTFDGCHFEGALIPLGVFSVKNGFSPSCMYYAASGGVTILLGGPTATHNSIYGQVQDKNPGYPDVVAVRFRSNEGDYISNNRIELVSFVQNAGQVDYGTKSGGNNVISINGYVAGGYDFAGTPHPNDLDVRQIAMTGNMVPRYTTQRPPRIAASVAFDGTNGDIISSTNVSAVSKTGVGKWTITFSETIPTGAKCVASCSSGPGPGFNDVKVPYSNSETSQDIEIFNTASGVVDDGSSYVDLVIIAPVI